jgi:hypothetical protein
VKPHRLAVWALTLAVVSLAVPVVPAVLALVLAVWAARSTRDAPEEAPGGRGLVPAAVALSVVGVVVWTGLAAAVALVPTPHEEPMAVAARLEVPPTTATPTTTAPTTATPTAATPTTTTPNPVVDDEQWLAGIEKLADKLDARFADSLDPTPATARSLAKLFRGCDRELAGLGSPSDQLEPAYRLAKQACARYHKAGECLAALAGLPEGQRQDQALTCADPQDEGSMLFLDAQAEAESALIG